MANPAPCLPRPVEELVDDLTMPDTYADGVAGLSLNNGVIKITFFSLRPNHCRNPAPFVRVTCDRVALPVAAGEALHKSLGEILERARTAAQPASVKPTLQ